MCCTVLHHEMKQSKRGGNARILQGGSPRDVAHATIGGSTLGPAQRMAMSTDRCEVPWQDWLGNGHLDRVTLALVGPAAESSRVARLVFIVLSQLTNAEGRPAFGQVVIVLPPDKTDTVRAEVMTDTAQIRGFALDDDEIDVLSRRLQIQQLASFDSAEVLRAVTAAAPGSFVVIVDGARYRPVDPAHVAPSSLQAPEDRWVAPLVELARQCDEQVGTGTCVLIDAGEFLPALDRNKQAFENAQASIWGADAPKAINDAQMLQFQEWAGRVERGDILSVLGEIEGTPRLSGPQRLLTKIQILHKGGRAVRALEFLREYLPHLNETPTDLKLKLATIALAGEDLDLARELLESSANNLCDLDVNELALELTQSIPSTLVEVHCLTWLTRYYPVSSMLEEHQLQRLLLADRDGQPARVVGGPPLPLDEYVDAVLSPLRAEMTPDYAALVEALDARWPMRQTETRLAATLDARRRGLPMHVAMLASSIEPGATRTRAVAILLLWAIERLLLIGDEREILADAVLFMLRYLAVQPTDTASRERLDELLSVDIAGITGLALLAHALLRLLAASEDAPIVVPEAADGEVEPDTFMPFYRNAVTWLGQQRFIDLATVRLPEALMTLPANKALRNLGQLMRFTIEQEQHDEGHNLRLLVLVAFAVAPHANRCNDDLEILRLATSRLVVSGEAQLARDLVEAGLAATHGRPERLRLAWYAYGDVYLRMHDGPRALIAFGCALATHGTVEQEHAYYETMGIARALRDTGLLEPARQLLDRGEQLLTQLGMQTRRGHRIETMRLSIQMAELKATHSRDGAAWSALLLAIDANLQAVMREQDELAMALMIAVQVLRQAEELGLVVDEVRERIETGLAAAGAITAELVQLAANTAVGPERLLERARTAQAARYADDVAFDIQYLVRAARNQLSDDATVLDSTAASFSAEITTDHGISLPGGVEGGWLPASIDEPVQTLEDLSSRGLRIEMLAFDSDDRLVRVSANAGVLTVQREDAAFSLRRLQEWSLRFPYEYGLDTDEANLFYTSMNGLGLSLGAGERAIFILDTRLQRLPPQLLLINGDLLGHETAVAVAPSLSWLKAAVATPRKPYAPPAAWISTAVEGDGNGTLATVADRAADVLEGHGIALQTGDRLPEHLKGAQLAIVAAHGGLADENRYFQVLSDEARFRMSAPALARALEGAGVVVLFVCSGGRQDEHPNASTTVGLPKQLLDRGSRAVIASPWPLDSRVPSHWLPAFLAEWDAGGTLIDANAAGNRAVGTQMGGEPRDALAMTLYGNPLLRQGDLSYSNC